MQQWQGAQCFQGQGPPTLQCCDTFQAIPGQFSSISRLYWAINEPLMSATASGGTALLERAVKTIN